MFIPFPPLETPEEDDASQSPFNIHSQPYTNNSKAQEGVGMILRETSALWVPKGHLIFAIIAEFNPSTQTWQAAENPC